MAIQEARPVGLGGLDLGTDPTITSRLTIADGIRYFEKGAAHSRGGRRKTGLSFPDEGYGNPIDYVQEIPHFWAGGRVQGSGAFYDERIETRDANGVIVATIPQRLNFVTKSNGRFKFNNEDATYVAGPGDFIEGDGAFDSVNTRCKFVSYGNKVYIIDESTDPKVLKRRPLTQQTQYKRVRYDVRRMGIRWPFSTTAAPTVGATADAGFVIPTGTYRVRITLLNKNGIESNPSLTGIFSTIQTIGTETSLSVSWSNADFPINANSVSKVRIYLSYTEPSSAAIEPSDYYYIKDVDAATTSATLRVVSVAGIPDEVTKRTQNIRLNKSQGAPPKLRDMVIINDVAYAIAMPSSVERETLITQGEGRFIGNEFWITNTRRNVQIHPIYDRTEVRSQRVDSSYLFISEVGEPETMETWVRISDDSSEVGVGLASGGDKCYVLTNLGIYIFDPTNFSLSRAYAKVGCLSRDSIVETEQGIFFQGTDGLFRLFNGATTDVIATELLPIFDREDYQGPYTKFDRTYAAAVNACFGKRKIFCSYPISDNPAITPPSKPLSSPPLTNLVIGDVSGGSPLWGVDKSQYDFVQYLGREGRLVGVDQQGYFFYFDESLLDSQPFGADQAVPFDVQVRKMPVGGFQIGNAYKLALDINTQGEIVTCLCQMDDDPARLFDFSVRTVDRQQVKQYLPAIFWGRFLSIRIYGSVTSRTALYGVTVESDTREVF